MEKKETIGLRVSDKASPNMEERSLIESARSPDESYPSDKVVCYDDHLHRSLLSTNGGDDGGGPTPDDSGANEVGRSSFSPTTSRPSPRSATSNIFRDDVPAAVPHNTHGGGSAGAVRTLQPFDISHTAFKSPGGGMAAALGFPFTAAQWKELERQAMIYKYMVASLPVPADLLIPVTSRNFSDPTASLGNASLYGLRYSNRDPEPGRCKRTDGKKWRCSRDVAPHQKYCERHMHRGRPRSRKPVEVHPSVETNSNKKTRLDQRSLQTTNPTDFHSPTGQASESFSPLFLGTAGQPKDHLTLGGARVTGQNTSKSPYKEANRAQGWTMDGEMVATNRIGQQWLHLMDSKRGLPAARHSIYGTNASILHPGFVEEPLTLFNYADLPQEHIHSRNADCHLLLNPDLISLKQSQMDDYPNSRGFIDAWSNANLETINNEPSISSQGNLSPSSLDLSIAMAAGNVLDEQMGLTDVVHNPAADSVHPEPKDCAASWLPFSSGGPLAEVLQPSNMTSGSNPASPYATNADSISPPATAVSSPSGVLHRALFSQSDGSACNSPTIAVSAAPPEVVAFQWLN